MAAPNLYPLFGRCACNTVQYQIDRPPMFIQACHCTCCQRETGSAFVINAIIESSNVHVTSSTQPVDVKTPCASGDSQRIQRCPICCVALWSYYPQAGPVLAILRIATLDKVKDSKFALKPAAHIFTSTRQPWLDLGREIPQFEELYDRRVVWPESSRQRFEKVMPMIEEYRAGKQLTTPVTPEEKETSSSQRLSSLSAAVQATTKEPPFKGCCNYMTMR